MDSSFMSEYRGTMALLLLAGMIFVSLNRHSKNELNNYKSELWADKAGYNVYLPAAFIYSFDAAAMPDSIDALTGYGFRLNLADNRIETKYTYGVALLQAPFFLAAHGWSKMLAWPADGYSLAYRKAVDLAGAFYGWIGILFLFKFLCTFFSAGIAFTAVTLLFAGTGVFYYALIDTGMSHIYSFAAMSFGLLVASRLANAPNSLWWNLSFAVAIGLTLIIRPVNAILLPALFLFVSPIWFRCLSPKSMAIMVSTAVAFLVPQMLYWLHISGNPVFYAYGQEGFSNLWNPKLIEIWFAPHNGLFPYSPLLLLAIPGTVVQFNNGFKLHAAAITLLFLVISYVFASWWIWSYGCGFGSRPFIEFIPVLTLPLGWMLWWIRHRSSSLMKWLLGTLITAMVIWTQKLTFSYGLCWYWQDWDWNAFFTLLSGPTK